MISRNLDLTWGIITNVEEMYANHDAAHTCQVWNASYAASTCRSWWYVHQILMFLFFFLWNCWPAWFSRRKIFLPLHALTGYDGISSFTSISSDSDMEWGELNCRLLQFEFQTSWWLNWLIGKSLIVWNLRYKGCS